MKNLIPVMALVALMAAPAYAQCPCSKPMQQAAKAAAVTESTAAKAVNTLVVKPVKAAKDAVIKLTHAGLGLAKTAAHDVMSGVDVAIETVNGFVTGATGQ